MLSASKVPLDSFLSRQEIDQVSPYIEMYSLLVKSKNLGIPIPLDAITTHDLDMIHEFYSTFENTRSKAK